MDGTSMTEILLDPELATYRLSSQIATEVGPRPTVTGDFGSTVNVFASIIDTEFDALFAT